MNGHVCSFVLSVCVHVCWENIHLLIPGTPNSSFFFTNKRFINKRFIIIPLVFIKSLIVFRNPNLNTTENATFHKQFKLFTDEAN